MTPTQSDIRYQLVPWPGGGYKISQAVLDHDFDPPLLAHVRYLNGGRRFKSRDDARDFMRATEGTRS